MEIVILTLVDTAHGDAPVPDALVNIYNAAGSALVTYQRTTPDGVVAALLPPGTYVTRLYKAGLSSVEQEVVVADLGGETLQEFRLECETIVVPPAASPDLCRMYADFLTQDGKPFYQFKLRVENLYNPASIHGMAVIEATREYQTDQAGHVEFDLVRGTRVRVALLTTPWTREFVAPDKPVESLLSVFGVASDAFKIAKR